MNKHRSTAKTVQNDRPLDNLDHIDNLDPQDAVESLRAAILQVDTLAQLASHAVDELRCHADVTARRAFARMQILVGKVADEAHAALAHSDEVMAALSKRSD